MLKFIGTGDLANIDFGNTSAFIKHSNDLLLIDCGTTVFERLLKLKLLENISNIYVAITHNHPDHIASLASLIFYCNYWKNIKVNIIVPCSDMDRQKQAVKLFLQLQGITEDLYNLIYDKKFSFYDLKEFIYFQITHSDIPSYAIQMKFTEKNIYYLGDNNDVILLENLLKIINTNDLIYTDCTTYHYENNVHLTLDSLKKIVSQEKRANIYCMHFCSGEDLKMIKNEGFNIALMEND